MKILEAEQTGYRAVQIGLIWSDLIWNVIAVSEI